MCFGLYRCILTYGTLSRSFAHSSWDILYLWWRSRWILLGMRDARDEGFRESENMHFVIHGKWPTWRAILFYVFISFLYLFRATSCSSSGESIVPIQPLVHVTVCRSETCTPNGHLQTVTRTRGCIDKIDSPDDEHEVARNRQRNEINT